MILKNFDLNNDYLEYTEGKMTRMENYSGSFNGYYQNHKAGFILFSFRPDDFLMINDKAYDVSSLKKVVYSADGIQRNVQFIDYDGNITDAFEYVVFWDNEADMLQFAMELPGDQEKDLLKFISNKISDR